MLSSPPPPQKSKHSLLAPIFLFSNWRTGGTALAFTFRKHDDCYVYTEPLNPILKDPDLALGTKTSSWKSKHPENEYYFTEYEPLLTAPGHSFFFPDLEKIPYVLQTEDKQEDLREYFSSLISFAHSKNKIPVFKFEQMEGSASWVKANFPDSLCVGVTRNADYQFISWLEQATYGNYSFFETAHRIIEQNLSFFKTDSIPVRGRGDLESYQKTFDVFKRTIDLQHNNFMDFCVDISPESEESLDVQLRRVESCDSGRMELWRFILQTVHDTLIREPDTRVTITRLANHLKTIVARDEVIDTVLAEKNAILAEKNAILLELQRYKRKTRFGFAFLYPEFKQLILSLPRRFTANFGLDLQTLRRHKKRVKTMAVIIESLAKKIISPLRGVISRLRNSKNSTSMRDVFQRIYRINHWRSEVSHSGTGSDLIQTETIRQSLPSLLAELNVKKMLDVPCGDFHWMSHVDFGLELQYLGADVVPELIEKNNHKYGNSNRRFIELDVSRGELPKVDLIFCRDLLVHFSREDVQRTIANFKRSGATWLLTTTFTNRTSNEDIETGDWRTLNLEISPFNFPKAHKIINEGCTEFGTLYSDKSLGLWKLSEI